MRYVLTKLETIRRTEKVEYTLEIPRRIKNKEAYAENQITEAEYKKYKVVDIVDSEFLDDEIVGLKAAN